MHSRHARLVRRLLREAETLLQGRLSATTRTCGNPGCRCHRGARHGPHTYLTFQTPEGRSRGVYVPAARGRFWQLAVPLATRNRQAAVARWRGAGRPRRRDAPTGR